jgi:hypothetical protein
MAGSAAGMMKRLAAKVGIVADEFARRCAAGEKYCWRCTALHPRSAFDVDPSRVDGLNPACRDSRNRAAKAAYVPRPRKSKLGKFFAPSRAGDKRQARARVNHRVEIGTIPCMDCGHVHAAGERRHEYDHHLGYAAEHQLDVQAVCTTCHRKRERARG